MHPRAPESPTGSHRVGGGPFGTDQIATRAATTTPTAVISAATSSWCCRATKAPSGHPSLFPQAATMTPSQHRPSWAMQPPPPARGIAFQTACPPHRLAQRAIANNTEPARPTPHLCSSYLLAELEQRWGAGATEPPRRCPMWQPLTYQSRVPAATGQGDFVILSVGQLPRSRGYQVQRSLSSATTSRTSMAPIRRPG
jgi:hypothetical protein